MTVEELAWQLALKGEYQHHLEPPHVQMTVLLHDGTTEQHPVSGYGATTTEAARDLAGVLMRMRSPA